MKILLNAYNLKFAGGLNVALNFLQQLKKNHQSDTFFVLAPAHCGYEDFASEHIQIFPVPDFSPKYLCRYYLDYYWIPKLLRKLSPDVIFSMGNFPLPTRLKQALLFHYPHLIYPPSPKYKLSVKEKFILLIQYMVFRSRLKYVTSLFPQTHVAGNRLRKYYGDHLRINPVGNAYTKLKTLNTQGNSPQWKLDSECKHLICLTKYYPHKNLEILLEVGKLLKENNSQIRIITTIDARQHKRAKRFLENIKQLRLEAYVINLGPIDIYHVPQLYLETDGLILPTYLESFSGTYVDAMFFKKPIFTSGLDFAHEVCGDIAYYFDPDDAKDIYHIISQAFKQPEEMNSKIQAGEKRSGSFPDWENVTRKYIEALKSL